MTPQVKFLVDRYADWLIDQYNRGLEPTAYVFDPVEGCDPEATAALLEQIRGFPIRVKTCDRREWGL